MLYVPVSLRSFYFPVCYFLMFKNKRMRFSGFSIMPILWSLFLFQFNGEIQAQKAKAAHILTSDEAKIVKKDAGTLFASEDYKGALDSYRELVKSDPGNSEYNYRLGVCILRTTAEKTAALPLLLRHANGKDAKKDIDFYLGLAYMHTLEWDKAVESFQNYRIKSGARAVKGFPAIDRLIEMSANGKELCKKPLEVKFENPGKVINTSFEEYNPFISADGKSLFFSSRRRGNIGGFIEDLGIYTSDMYWSQWKDTIWTKPKSFGGLVNGEWDEELVGMSPAGDQALIYFDNMEYYADIGYSQLKGKSWQKPSMFSEVINSKQYEGAACISNDGQTMYFSSQRKDGLGGSDIWRASLDPNGHWTNVTNAGPEINTPHDDDFPNLSIDGKTLYFASKGHNSMGDYDLFKAEWDPAGAKWKKAVNMGYPINDADDNHTISFTGDGRYAYITSSRKDGFGNQDIWKVEFTDTSSHPFRSVINGKVVSETGTRIVLTNVQLKNLESRELTEFRPAGSGNAFVLSAKPGNYKLTVEGTNFITKTIEFSIDDSFPPAPVNQDVIVTPARK